MTIRRKRVNRQIVAICDTPEDWLEALWMDKPIQAPEVVKRALTPFDGSLERLLILESLIRRRRHDARRLGGPRRPPPRWKKPGTFPAGSRRSGRIRGTVRSRRRRRNLSRSARRFSRR